jgi:hypothetical protein
MAAGDLVLRLFTHIFADPKTRQKSLLFRSEETLFALSGRNFTSRRVRSPAINGPSVECSELMNDRLL